MLPFDRFPDADTLLGPEMRSTGEVMGIDPSFGLAFAKSQAAAGDELPAGGHGVLLPGRPGQGRRAWPWPAGSSQLGFRLAATSGTAAYFEADGVPVDTVVAKVERREDEAATRPAGQVRGVDAVALIRDGQGRPGGQHPARPGPPGRRRPHPPGRQPAPGGLPDHRGRGPGRGGRHRRPGRQPAAGPQPAGVPRRRSSCPCHDAAGSRPAGTAGGDRRAAPRRPAHPGGRRGRWPTRS